ncbi:SAV_915 family protein [Amycolatopsis aidingensis]|uniref:SAV_915 family protein n=1 Tax=Amycolatopsis aidingensis TaxID=2842453 RepID=UPI001E4F95B7|nr:SAV_915 family protein [Amycolatopsis aidingensis]
MSNPVSNVDTMSNPNAGKPAPQPVPPGFPPMVYVPCGQYPTGEGGSTMAAELRRTEDGKLALLAYSALDRLVRCCGQHQPWVLVRSEELSRIYQAQPYEAILLDTELPERLRHDAAASG